jgi:hypothetical protein
MTLSYLDTKPGQWPPTNSLKHERNMKERAKKKNGKQMGLEKLHCGQRATHPLQRHP